MPADIAIHRSPLAIEVPPIYDIDGLRLDMSAAAAGIMDSVGALQLGNGLFTRDAEFHGNYAGTLSATDGTLTGTQVWN